jgi:hypothetical protein
MNKPGGQNAQCNETDTETQILYDPTSKNPQAHKRIEWWLLGNRRKKKWKSIGQRKQSPGVS